MVAAMAKNRVIGKDNQMPWHLPADLKHFKNVTMGKPVIMGRKTFESIGRPLPGRKNIVISRNSDFKAQGCTVVCSIDKAISEASGVEEVMIIGGGFLYSQMLDQADKLYLTFIELEVDGDTQFPAFEHLKLNEVKRSLHLADDKNPYNCTFVDYKIV